MCIGTCGSPMYMCCVALLCCLFDSLLLSSYFLPSSGNIIHTADVLLLLCVYACDLINHVHVHVHVHVYVTVCAHCNTHRVDCMSG